MANKVILSKYSPSANPDKALLGITVTGGYVQGTADPVNLTPGTWSDPQGLGVIGEPSALLTVSPSILLCNCQGYVCYWQKGTTLANGGLRWYAPGGAELATGAFPAAITAGEIALELFFMPAGV